MKFKSEKILLDNNYKVIDLLKEDAQVLVRTALLVRDCLNQMFLLLLINSNSEFSWAFIFSRHLRKAIFDLLTLN